jgi:molecular chaperone GrpE (heat shock protein)
MNDQLNWKVPKWPFIAADVALMAFGFYFVWAAPRAVTHLEIAALCTACVIAGSIIGILPFILDYRAIGKLIEINALGAVSAKIQSLEQFCAQISAATGRWAAVQEFVGDNAEKTATAAKQIADKMGAEVREFTEFVKKMNDGEKNALRLESEKNRRNEGEWVQTLVRILDHVFALHVAAVRSGQPKFAEQISQFQNTCRGMVQRLGLAVILTEPNEPFNPERHQAVGVKEKPAAGAITVETVAPGYTFQSKLVRPALVRLRDETPAPSPAPAPVAVTAPVVPPAPVSKPAPAIVPIPATSIPGEKAKAQVPAQNTLALEAD